MSSSSATSAIRSSCRPLASVDPVGGLDDLAAAQSGRCGCGSALTLAQRRRRGASGRRPPVRLVTEPEPAVVLFERNVRASLDPSTRRSTTKAFVAPTTWRDRPDAGVLPSGHRPETSGTVGLTDRQSGTDLRRSGRHGSRRDVRGGHLDALIARAEAALIARTRRSHELHVAAAAHLPGGVASSWQDAPPCPVFIDRASGSRMWDVDGTEYVDMHAGFGTTLAGHGHPAHRRGDRRPCAAGTHFAQPVPDIIPVAAELARRFGLPMWRFTNSGTESTLAAVHLMRAATGRTRLIKVEGPYHGHHDTVQVSVFPDARGLRPARPPDHRPRARRRAAEVADLVHVVPFGRLDAVRRVLLEHPGEIAGMIVEPVMMNIGVVAAAPRLPRRAADAAAHPRRPAHVRRGQDRPDDRPRRRHRALRRRARHRVPRQGARRRRAVRRDRRHGRGDGAHHRRRVRAGRHVQRQPADDGRGQGACCSRSSPPPPTRHSTSCATSSSSGPTSSNRHHLPGYVSAFGAKGAIVFSPVPIRDYRDFCRYDARYGHGHWLYQHDGGVFLPPWGKMEQWTLSVQHGPATSPSSSPTSSGSPRPDRAERPPAGVSRQRS